MVGGSGVEKKREMDSASEEIEEGGLRVGLEDRVEGGGICPVDDHGVQIIVDIDDGVGISLFDPAGKFAGEEVAVL
jgi:hypothetical protein